MSSSPTIAWLSDGVLTRARPDQPPEPLESHFVQAALDREATQRERNSFRAKGMMWNFHQAAGIDPNNLPPEATDARSWRFTSVTAGSNPNEIFYAIQNAAIGGLFVLNTAENYERRLVHRQQLELRDIAFNAASAEIACSLRTPTGATHLGVMKSDGSGLHEVTTGDSIDEAPAWVPDRPRTLLFQSAGIGRHENGMIFGLGPYGICQLDLASESLSTLLEMEKFDCLAPKRAPDGSLFYIRRPYQLRPAVSPLKVAADILLFPFRAARAAVHFMNAFSMMFSKKPLITAGGPQHQGPDRRALMLWGRWVEVDRKLRYARPNDDPPLVPATWQLIRRAPDGSETTLANRVVAYDLGPDSAVFYTNGSTVYAQPPGEKPRRIARGRFIERLTILA